MKTSDKLIEVYDKFRPHINGHRTAMNLFLEALKEVEEMEQELSKLHQPTVSGRSEQLVCKGKCDWGYTDGDGNELFCSIKKK